MDNRSLTRLALAGTTKLAGLALLLVTSSASIGCNKDTASSSPGDATAQPDAQAGGPMAQSLNVEEKKALRASNEAIEAATKTLADAGLAIEASLDPSPVDAYDLEALGRSRGEVLGELGKVPAAILEAMATIAEDPDYKAPFQAVQRIAFIPSDNARGEGFDFDATVTCGGSTLTISYAPLTSMNGGYERAIKKCF